MPLERPQIEELLKMNEGHYCGEEKAHICVRIVAVADLPTRFGQFQKQ